MNRLEANLLILKLLSRYFKEAPDMRFIQGLWACNIVDREDRFHEESDETLKKISEIYDGSLLNEEFIYTTQLISDIKDILNTDTIPERDKLIPKLVEEIKRLKSLLNKKSVNLSNNLTEEIYDLKEDLENKSEVIKRLMKEKSDLFKEFSDTIENITVSFEKTLSKNILTDTEKVMLKMLVEKICENEL